MTSAVYLTEEQRQAVLLAVAKLAVERPGWDYMLGEVADAMSGRKMYENFKKLHEGVIHREESREEKEAPDGDAGHP
jgi:hypothetical protein